MPRPLTLFTGQWADLPLDTLAQKVKSWGYDGVELACWGDHFDVQRATTELAYCKAKHAQLAAHGLKTWAISNHLVGQAVCDVIDERHRAILPPRVWGNALADMPLDAEAVRARAARELIDTAKAAKALGVPVVNGFTGSSIWYLLYFFPPTTPEHVKKGYDNFAQRFGPILDAFQHAGVKFALEVHPTEVAYDIHTARAALSAVGNHPAFGFNFDPSHLHWQFVDPVQFLRAFPDRIFHCHVKDCARTLDGSTSILASHLPFGDHRRGWDFRSPGRGQVDFQAIIRELNRIGYAGPLSVEWEDPAMDREAGAREAATFVRALDFPPSERAFDAAFAER
jgi:sugar phosphate isomerase/epimerase